MNLVLLTPNDFIDNSSRVRLDDRRFAHIRDVHRIHIGDTLCVGLMGGKSGIGRITSLTAQQVEMDVDLCESPPDPLPATLVLALPRPNIFKRVLQTVSSMGVKRIFIVNSSRVEKSFWLSPVLAPERIQEQLILGLEQAKDTIVPEVVLRPLFKPFVEDELPRLIAGSLALVAHPEAAQECLRETDRPVTLAIGPEGGFIPYEIEKLTSLGFTPVRLGNRILRVDVAIPALLSKLLF
ncbi:MAG: 16S rRNA (uracil(1498)-N(3))-methyltransferase [Omnitrophica WOR_2 bacterium RIFCSPHIGHO2_02_FULL_50_17]|nr:MAG: 16S rRNA (uracil(1498)-N(3))-methyltransferase [Omnitrophica WOR_2 bacterium RIFCSPHIGHO2_02_FULL_50_17]